MYPLLALNPTFSTASTLFQTCGGMLVSQSPKARFVSSIIWGSDRWASGLWSGNPTFATQPCGAGWWASLTAVPFRPTNNLQAELHQWLFYNVFYNVFCTTCQDDLVQALQGWSLIMYAFYTDCCDDLLRMQIVKFKGTWWFSHAAWRIFLSHRDNRDCSMPDISVLTYVQQLEDYLYRHCDK